HGLERAVPGRRARRRLRRRPEALRHAHQLARPGAPLRLQPLHRRRGVRGAGVGALRARRRGEVQPGLRGRAGAPGAVPRPRGRVRGGARARAPGRHAVVHRRGPDRTPVGRHRDPPLRRQGAVRRPPAAFHGPQRLDPPGRDAHCRRGDARRRTREGQRAAPPAARECARDPRTGRRMGLDQRQRGRAARAGRAPLAAAPGDGTAHGARPSRQRAEDPRARPRGAARPPGRDRSRGRRGGARAGEGRRRPRRARRDDVRAGGRRQPGRGARERLRGFSRVAARQEGRGRAARARAACAAGHAARARRRRPGGGARGGREPRGAPLRGRGRAARGGHGGAEPEARDLVVRRPAGGRVDARADLHGLPRRPALLLLRHAAQRDVRLLLPRARRDRRPLHPARRAGGADVRRQRARELRRRASRGRAAGRAAMKSRAGRRASGASTIAMQVARLERPGPRTYPRKLVEALAALALTARYGHAAVLAHYLRIAPYGNRVRGIAYAARRYLGKPVEDLSWAETAFLAAIPQAPARMNPYRAVAWVGSAGYFDARHAGAYDYAGVPRSPGSTLKPFLYALALERGAITPATILDDILRTPGDITNADEAFLGPLLPRVALANSRNVPAANLLDRIGLDDGYAFLRDLGLHDG